MTSSHTISTCYEDFMCNSSGPQCEGRERTVKASCCFVLVDVPSFIYLPAYPLNLSCLYRATPDLHKDCVNSRQSLSFRTFPSIPTITQKCVYKQMWSAHSAGKTAHAIAGRETQSRNTVTYRSTGQIQHCNFIQDKVPVAKLHQGIFQAEKCYEQIKVIYNRIRQNVPQPRFRALGFFSFF